MEIDEQEEYYRFVKREIEYGQLYKRDKNILSHIGLRQGLEEIRNKGDHQGLFHVANFHYQELKNSALHANKCIDYVKLLKYVELKYHFSLTSPIFPNFIFLPPYINLDNNNYQKEYKQITRDWIKFHEAGIIPIDQSILNEILDLNTPCLEGNSAFIDLDYFIMFHKNKPNIFFGQALIDIYMSEIPELINDKTLILNIGSIRAQKTINNECQPVSTMLAPVEYEANSREDLLAIIENIKFSNTDFEIWFRGQPNEYYLKNLQKEAIQGVVPYRNIIDISLPPSLYRSTPQNILDIKAHTMQCLDLSYYSFLMSEFLDMDKADLISNISSSTMPANSLSNFENPLRWSVLDKFNDGEKRETVKQYDPVTNSITKSLFLQHYGLPTNILDITSDIDVALFFAQMSVEANQYLPSKHDHAYIYIFLLDPKKDMMLNSSELLKKTKLLRPVRQKCGLLYGSSMINRNHYSRYISVKIKLTKKIEMNYSTSDLFPDETEDLFLKFIKEAAAENKDLNTFPFDPEM